MQTTTHARLLELQAGTSLGVDIQGLHDSEFPEAITGIPHSASIFTDFSNKYVGTSHAGNRSGVSKFFHYGEGSSDGDSSSSTFDLLTSGTWLGDSFISKMMTQLGIFITSERFMQEMGEAVSAACARKNLNLNDPAVIDALDTVIAQEGIVLGNLNIGDANAEQTAEIVQNAVMQGNRGLFSSKNAAGCDTSEEILDRCATGMDGDFALILGQRAFELQLERRMPTAIISGTPAPVFN